MTRGAGRAVRPPRRVVLLSESMGLAALLRYLLGASGTLTRFATLREADDRDGLDDADTVVLDLPREGADTVLAQVRHRYRGELIVLANRGTGRPKAAADLAWSWTVLERPFSAVDLGKALGLPGLDAATAPGPKADRHPPVEIRTARPIPPALAGTAVTTPAEVKAAARRSPGWTSFATTTGAKAGLVERASRFVATLTQGWQAKRRVRVAGFSVFALVAFTVAFALAAQSGRCGPGCDALGTVFAPDPTVAPSESSAPSTTGPKRSTTTAGAKAGPAGTGSFQGVSGGRVAAPTTTTIRRATTTTDKPSSGGSPTTRPPTTRPPTTPTTQPPTTPTTEPPTTPTTAPPTTASPAVT
jgi:hypothetical protein